MGIEYDQVALMDSSTMIKWNAPNFFNLTGGKFTAWRDSDNLKWIYDSIQGYKDFFNGYELDITKYFSSGLIIFNKNHRKLFKKFKQFYLDNIDKLIELQDKDVKKGTEQTPFNYWLQMNNVDVNIDLPIAFKLTHMHRKELFHHNWQDGDDKTPFFIKYGYNWIFNGIPKDQRTGIIKQTWDLIKDKYNMESAIYDNVLDEVLHKDVAKYTTSRKFKMDLLQIFKNDKYKYLKLFFKDEEKAFYKIIFVKWINHKKNIALVYFPDYSLEILITLFVSIEIYSNKIYKVKYIINDSNLLEFIY